MVLEQRDFGVPAAYEFSTGHRLLGTCCRACEPPLLHDDLIVPWEPAVTKITGRAPGLSLLKGFHVTVSHTHISVLVTFISAC